jgi:ATP-binding cassette subfamily F protein 3
VITAKNLTKKYGETTILDNVDFKIGNGRKIGLVGRNGCGKSTLFRVINRVEEETSGNVEVQGETLGYIPQEFDFPNKLVGEYLEEKLESHWDFYRIEELVHELAFTNFDPYQELNTLSEGQKMKVKLIETLLTQPTTLFIDEPTNHLDIEGIMWFEEYVKALRISVVMISHDRSFLNHVVDEIWEIEKGKIFRFVGDYDNYKEEKMKLINKWDREFVLFIKKKAQLETLLENVRKIKDGKKRGRAVSSVKKRIDREVTSNEKEKYEVKRIKDLKFETAVHPSKLMLRFNSVCKKFGDHTVFENLSFEVRGKEKVWLYGPNGAGKTTITKIIMGDEQVNSGEVKIGDNIKIGYFAQTQSKFDRDLKLLDCFEQQTGCYFAHAYGLLNKFLFSKEDVNKRIWQLSPGERARFAFAIFAYKDYDLLILDEPDNHLDIETKEVLERSLNEFAGTVLLVSHDRYFVESVGVSKVLNLRDGRLNLFDSF